MLLHSKRVESRKWGNEEVPLTEQAYSAGPGGTLCQSQLPPSSHSNGESCLPLSGDERFRLGGPQSGGPKITMHVCLIVQTLHSSDFRNSQVVSLPMAEEGSFQYILLLPQLQGVMRWDSDDFCFEAPPVGGRPKATACSSVVSQVSFPSWSPLKVSRQRRVHVLGVPLPLRESDLFPGTGTTKPAQCVCPFPFPPPSP